jgi:hypothetical protein
MLPRVPAIGDLERHLRTTVKDSLFAQAPKGLARRLFAEFSRYTHGVSGFTDADARESNGPIFVAKAFLKWCVAALKTYSVCLHELKLAHPLLDELPCGPPKLRLDEVRRGVFADIPERDKDREFFKALVDFRP